MSATALLDATAAEQEKAGNTADQPCAKLKKTSDKLEPLTRELEKLKPLIAKAAKLLELPLSPKPPIGGRPKTAEAKDEGADVEAGPFPKSPPLPKK